jgi:hypothetical protein
VPLSGSVHMMLRRAAALLLLAAAAFAAAPRPRPLPRGDRGGLVAAADADGRPRLFGAAAKPPTDLPAEPLTFAPLNLAKRAMPGRDLPKPYVSTGWDAWATRKGVLDAVDSLDRLAANAKSGDDDEYVARALLASAVAEARAADALPQPGIHLSAIGGGQCPSRHRRDDGAVSSLFLTPTCRRPRADAPPWPRFRGRES